jgi:hypothetical protein
MPSRARGNTAARLLVVNARRSRNRENIITSVPMICIIVLLCETVLSFSSSVLYPRFSITADILSKPIAEVS